MKETPFDTLESAEEFLQLLLDEIGKTSGQIEELVKETPEASQRRLEALRLVMHKLKQLEKNTENSQRLLGDLRMLRTLLLKESNKM